MRPADLQLRRGPSDFPPRFYLRVGGAFSGELRISGIVKFGGLVAPPLPPSCDMGLTSACSDACLLAVSGGCPVSMEGISASLLLLLFFSLGMLDVLFRIRLRNWGVGESVMPRRGYRGVCVSLLPPPRSTPPALGGPRVLP